MFFDYLYCRERCISSISHRELDPTKNEFLESVPIRLCFQGIMVLVIISNCYLLPMIVLFHLSSIP